MARNKKRIAGWLNETEKSNSFVFLSSEEVNLFEEKINEAISEFLLYKIEEKAGILKNKLQINYAEEKSNIKEKEELKKQVPYEWIIINKYLFHKWKEKENILELKTSEKISDNLKFLKKLVFNDLGFEEIKHDNLREDLRLDKLGEEIPRKWGEFKIKQIFDIKKDESLLKRDVKPGDYYYISRSEKNNGIKLFSGNKSETGNTITIENGNVLTVEGSAGSGASFYQDKPFTTDGKVHKLKLKSPYSLNVYRGLFLNAMLKLNAEYYDRGNLRNDKRLKRETIKLPLNEKGEIDWEFMDIYIYI